MAEMLLDMESQNMATSTSYIEIRGAYCKEVMAGRVDAL